MHDLGTTTLIVQGLDRNMPVSYFERQVVRNRCEGRFIIDRSDLERVQNIIGIGCGKVRKALVAPVAEPQRE